MCGRAPPHPYLLKCRLLWCTLAARLCPRAVGARATRAALRSLGTSLLLATVGFTGRPHDVGDAGSAGDVDKGPAGVRAVVNAGNKVAAAKVGLRVAATLGVGAAAAALVLG